MQIYANSMLFLAALLGISIGSFLNVVIYRMGSGTHLGGRSKCLSCGKTLTASMLLPLVSFIFQRGRCRYCKSKLSLQYPLVEAGTGALFALVALHNGITLPSVDALHLVVALLESAIFAILMVILVYDWKHKIIPDKLSLLFALISGILLYIKSTHGLIALPYLPFLDRTPIWINWAAAPIVSLPLALIWFFSAGRGMGLGDAKFAWGIGWFLGLGGAVSAVALSFWTAFFPSLFLLFLRSKRFTMKSEIPFAPFLVLGTFLAYAWNVNILSWTF